MKILLTGASGYLGTVLQSTLQKQHELITLGRSGDHIPWEIPQPLPNLPASDLVVHAAGLAHQMKNTPETEKAMFAINLSGTELLLRGLKKNPPRQFVFISTVAVYGCDSGKNIDENQPLLGKTAYALSKIAAEKACREWGETQGVAVLILRLPLISGTNPPGNLGAMIRALRAGYYWRIGEGSARKSMVSAASVAALIAGLNGREKGVYNLTDGLHPGVREIEEHLAAQLKKPVKKMPAGLLKAMAVVGDLIPFSPLNSGRVEKLTSSLTFSDARARRELNWQPQPALNKLKIL